MQLPLIAAGNSAEIRRTVKLGVEERVTLDLEPHSMTSAGEVQHPGQPIAQHLELTAGRMTLVVQTAQADPVFGLGVAIAGPNDAVEG